MNRFSFHNYCSFTLVQLLLLFWVVFPAGISAKDNTLDPVVLQLRWKHQFQFAGFYIAKEKGFYKEAGLAVEIKEYDHSITVVDDVLSGKAAYGVGRSSLLIDRNQGKPVVALGVIYQSSPSILLSTNPQIQSPRDLRGKRIMITSDTAQSAAITAMLLVNGLSDGDYITQKHSFDTRDLVAQRTDAMASYLSNEPYLLEKSGAPYVMMDPKKYGFDFYGDILFTSENELKTKPDRVKSFYKASVEGWLWAFDNIEQTARIIHEKYNSQNKTLEALIYEGKTLKRLAFAEGVKFGHISKEKFRSIAQVYQLANLIHGELSLKRFIDPLGLNREPVRIGILAKRGRDVTLHRWKPLADYLSEKLDAYRFEIVPLDFFQLKESIAAGAIDFVITNTTYYVQMEYEYGISRIATLLNRDSKSEQLLNEFGGVILTRKDNADINEIADIRGKSFGAVNERSFGGWVMAYKTLSKNGLDREDFRLNFLNTHDAVVMSVLEGKMDAGTVRTDTLERMAAEKKIDLADIKVINAQHHEGFPYLVSTRLYPEWPFAKLKHTSFLLANEIVSELINISSSSTVAKQNHVGGWTVPLDYSSVHDVLYELHLPPFDRQDVHFHDVLKQYWWLMNVIVIAFILLMSRLLYVHHVNKNLDKYNARLDLKVRSRTDELEQANRELEMLARTDALTNINNRRYFMKIGKTYLDIARRNKTPLQLLSLDLDHFKRVNDTYGHQAGDLVLQEFSKTVLSLMRDSDLFGRIGGEEFCILLQNAGRDGARLFAERIRKQVESMQITYGEDIIKVTVSIGIAELGESDEMGDLLKKSDMALYDAKRMGRNYVCTG